MISTPELASIIFLGILNAGLFLILDKVKVIEKYELYKPKKFSSCNFCFFFWVAAIEFSVFAFWTATVCFETFAKIGGYSIAAATISRFLL